MFSVSLQSSEKKECLNLSRTSIIRFDIIVSRYMCTAHIYAHGAHAHIHIHINYRSLHLHTLVLLHILNSTSHFIFLMLSVYFTVVNKRSTCSTVLFIVCRRCIHLFHSPNQCDNENLKEYSVVHFITIYSFIYQNEENSNCLNKQSILTLCLHNSIHGESFPGSENRRTANNRNSIILRSHNERIRGNLQWKASLI